MVIISYYLLPFIIFIERYGFNLYPSFVSFDIRK